jgi:hypothetical protein
VCQLTLHGNRKVLCNFFKKTIITIAEGGTEMLPIGGRGLAGGLLSGAD